MHVVFSIGRKYIIFGQTGQQIKWSGAVWKGRHQGWSLLMALVNLIPPLLAYKNI